MLTVLSGWIYDTSEQKHEDIESEAFVMVDISKDLKTNTVDTFRQQ